MIHKLWLNFQEFGYIILDVLSTDYLGKIIHDIIGLVQGWHLQFLRTPFDVLKIRSHGPVRGRPNLIRVRGPHSIPFLSSFFDSSKFFLNLFAACFIFTKVLALVLTHVSCPSFTPGTSLVWVWPGFSPSSGQRGGVMFERLYDMSILDFQPVTLDMSGKYLGFTLAMWHDSYPNSSPNPIQNVFSYWLNHAYVIRSNTRKFWEKFLSKTYSFWIMILSRC